MKSKLLNVFETTGEYIQFSWRGSEDWGSSSYRWVDGRWNGSPFMLIVILIVTTNASALNSGFSLRSAASLHLWNIFVFDVPHVQQKWHAFSAGQLLVTPVWPLTKVCRTNGKKKQILPDCKSRLHTMWLTQAQENYAETMLTGW